MPPSRTPSAVICRCAKVYSFEPIPDGLAPEFQSHILGAQGNLWTEYIPNLKHAEYMIFPRVVRAGGSDLVAEGRAQLR